MRPVHEIHRTTCPFAVSRRLHAAAGCVAQGSSLKLSQLDQVLERLQHQAELRLMAVTGCPSTLETLTWQALEDPGTWEVQAQQLAQKLWHSWSVKMALKGLKKTLASLQEMLLDETGKQDARARRRRDR
ncbi:Uncharacterized protein SCF082_LOCUS53006 [Durusdinium trenchii]|uniref:Uncharacterized protein n=1 Tax=Durusdinium trenchii TaxID=1381693 RepID=A0ABP0SQ33_9DINO